MYGIKIDFIVKVEEFTARENSKGQVVVRGGWTVGPEFFEPGTDHAIAINKTMETHGYVEVVEWFNDGGVTYAANYPGKDVLGRKFEKGARIIRKARQTLLLE